MKPAFALSLSFEGISLLHRTAGGWRCVGEVPVDSSDLQAELSDLRTRALMLDSTIQCKVIIPDDQIRYLSVDIGEFRGEAEQNIIENAISDATPYGLSELKYDVAMDGPIAHVAAVALDTLSEAEEFAIQNGFEPVSYVAAPRDDTFPGEPFFGPSRITIGLTGSNAVEPDGVAVMDLGPVEFPEPTPPVAPPDPPDTGNSNAAAQNSEIEKANPPAPVAEPKAAPPAPDINVGFSSRRNPQPANSQPTPSVRPLQETQQASKKPNASLSKEAHATADDRLDTAFTSKRSPVVTTAPAVRPVQPETPPVIAQPIADLDPALDFASQKKPETAAPRDETDRMTVFGARKPQKVGGKPKYLGVILTALLVLLIAAVASWAALFSDTGFLGLSRKPDAPPQTQEQYEPERPDTPSPVAPQPDTATDPKPELPDLVASVPREVDGPFQSETPSLTDTDSAVLDALRIKPQQVEVAPIPAEPLVGEALYAATGIWPQAPQSPPSPGVIGLDDLYVASIDRTDLFQDAIALPTLESFDTDKSIARSASPVAAGSRFDLDARGLVKPTPEGTLSPDGILVHLGRPPVVPPTPPVRFEAEPEQADTQQDYLATLRPKLRPDNLVENNERTQLGGLSRAELAKVRPKLRPTALATAYAEAQVEAEAEKPDPETIQEAEATATATALAVAQSPLPKRRPKGLASRVKRNTNLGSVAGLSDAPNAPEPGTFVARTVTPKKPSTASVARQATLENAINLRRLNLIGVYGTPANRRALIRLPSGRYKKVKVGDRVDGGRVVAIGDSELRYQKSGRNMTLKIPKG
ncbi:hypothetical protein DS909_16835 [Phaeobacter gallaeciensis]|uniref:Type IV pilus biogenesis n=2 Tax=Roseobacteraceae TaxID=2854170 RepID=A0A366WS95_9RHOB|nr:MULTISPECIES: hypothetical protein [Roseobacteraceae]MBT3140953.1 hypothetical protein [Falsiruegeria litorea]MBT8170697.1 hypothetical protein [Falsiruegeria litorea]RBW52895.1 hypothetical protein DS909_16835 [Phaeobacter gallaeciensis]